LFHNSRYLKPFQFHQAFSVQSDVRLTFTTILGSNTDHSIMPSHLHILNWAPVSIKNFNFSFTPLSNCKVTVSNDAVAALYNLPLLPGTSGAASVNPRSVFRTNSPPPRTTCHCTCFSYTAKITACITSDPLT
jgi:hypothetical protein